LETSINIVEKISVFLNKVDPSIHPSSAAPPVDELFDELSGKNFLGHLKKISCKGMLRKKEKKFLQAIGG
jgi:hypothetical protein